MASTPNYSYIGNGEFWLRDRDQAGSKLIRVGNVSQANYAIEETSTELPDYRKGGGGLYNSNSRIGKVTFAGVFHDLSPENLARVTRGTATTIASSPVVDEVQVAKLDGLVRTTYVPDIDTIVVKDNAGTTTYTLDVDYEVCGAGIIPLSSGAIVDDANIKISYTKLNAFKVEALTATARLYEMVFVGLNEAASGKPFIVHTYKVRLSPASEIALISSDFGELPVNGTVLADTSIVGTGLSQYMKFDAQVLS